MTAVPWRFWVEDALAVLVSAAPSEDHRTAFFEAAVPALAARGWPAATVPLIVAGHISEGVRRPGGPAGRGRAFLDALHDDRKSGPKYRDLGAPAPIPDDTPRHVGGLALEVRLGAPETRYPIGARLRVAGRLLAEVPVRCAAPNDIASTSGERARIGLVKLFRVTHHLRPQVSDQVREITGLINEHVFGGASKDTKAVVARIDSASDAREDFKP